MKYLKKFNENKKLSDDDKNMILSMGQDCLVELIDNGYLLEFKYNTSSLAFMLDNDKYDFLWDDVKEEFLKFLELLSEFTSVQYVFFYYYSNSYVYRTTISDLLNGKSPYNKYNDDNSLRLISISFK